MRFRLNVLTLVLWAVPATVFAQVRFADDFSGDLSGWEIVGSQKAIAIRDSGDTEHGNVLVLEPDGAALALVRDSDHWGPVRVEADVLFPDDKHNYLGLIYNYVRTNARTDFGSLYLKGNGSYIRANPWRDGNVSRLLYEEYKTPLSGEHAIGINQWHRIRMEVAGRMCHLYVDDLSIPKVTFGLYEHSQGLVGFNPRVAGWPVWIDNVKVTSIEALSYGGPPIPEIDYEPSALITDWEVIGPVAKPLPEIESGDGTGPWRSFDVDPRGAVVTGRVTEYEGSRPIAYFRTNIRADVAKTVDLHLSTTDEFALWLNGRFHGFVYRNGYMFGRLDWNAWHDFWKNPKHEGSRVALSLRPGNNYIVIRVRNGQFASGGFFARLEPR